MIQVGQDLGCSNRSLFFKILIPQCQTAIISTFLFAFLLTFNEYPRTFYLSGSDVYLSEYLNGKLSSGANNSILCRCDLIYPTNKLGRHPLWNFPRK